MMVSLPVNILNTQADLNIHWLYMFEGTLSDIAAGTICTV